MIRPKLPVLVRVLNCGEREVRRVGFPLVRLEEESLLAAAREKIGLDDSRTGTFKVGLRRLLQSWKNEARVGTLGRVIARTETIKLPGGSRHG